jgi:RNA polymerase sigma-70 factor (ECF subfamily)
MMSPPRIPTNQDQFEGRISAARDGSEEALAQVLELCRPYLLRIANDELAGDLQAKIGASDLVQETFLDAHRDLSRFSGATEAQWLAWLRGILQHKLANLIRHYRQTDKRQVQGGLPLPSPSADGHTPELIAPDSSPSARARAHERDEALARALAQLPKPQQHIIRLRSYGDLSFEEAGKLMGRSADAARKLWGRAVEQLQQLLEAPDESR